MLKKISKILILAALLILPVGAEATARYVTTTGTDTGGCTSGSECLTWNYAITQMVDGDTLDVADGTYSDTDTVTCPTHGSDSYSMAIVDLNCAASGCTIRATNGLGNVIGDGGNKALCLDNGDGVTIDGFQFDGQTTAASISLSDGVNLTDVTFNYNSNTGGTPLYHISSDNVTYTRVTLDNAVGCTVDNSSDFQTFIGSSSNVTIEQSFFKYDNNIMNISGSDNVTIKRTRFTMFTEHGIQLVQAPSDILLENNIFEDDGTCEGTPTLTGPRNILDMYECTNCTARNNTIVGGGWLWAVGPETYTGEAQAQAGCTGDVCDRSGIKVYNNILYDFASACTDFVHYNSSAFTTETTIAFDGNLYSGGCETWTESDSCGTDVNWATWGACDLWDGTDNSDVNGVNSAPSFTDYANDDYTPSSGSAAQVDAGVDGTDAQSVARCATEDYAGNSRTDGSCDIGAYELQGAGGGGGPPTPGIIIIGKRD